VLFNPLLARFLTSPYPAKALILMKKLLRNLVLLLTGFLTLLLIIGCGADEEDEAEAPIANFVSATPPRGQVAVNGTITITFDNPPADVTVNIGIATVDGKTAEITGPFPLGPLALTIAWADGTQTLDYTINGPDCCGLVVTGGSVRDGDKDVDPELINSYGVIEIEFNEELTGNIALQTESGADVGWLGSVEGTKGTLELVKGRELQNETTYVIRGRVRDATGNPIDVSVTFVTKGKE
jgi:hypothetical protein